MGRKQTAHTGYQAYRGKSRTGRRALAAAGILLALLALALLACYVRHRICLAREEALLTPPGTMVEVAGGRMHVYTEGSGPVTLVFLSGGGTCAPVLDFKSLYGLLSDTCRIAVVEKFGYGFSDESSRPRDIDTILEDTRAALEGAGIPGPYILCPHSMSGLEAIRWAQRYPGEVSAVVGLDMAVPASYEDMDISLPALRLAQLAVRSGLARLVSAAEDSAALQHGTLTQEERAQYLALFYRRSASADMLAEAAAVRDNAAAVAAGGRPQVPMLLLVSDGTGGTGFSTQDWRALARRYLTGAENTRLVELDCPHYIHDYEYDRINREIRDFLSTLTP